MSLGGEWRGVDLLFTEVEEEDGKVREMVKTMEKAEFYLQKGAQPKFSLCLLQMVQLESQGQGVYTAVAGRSANRVEKLYFMILLLLKLTEDLNHAPLGACLEKCTKRRRNLHEFRYPQKSYH